jgi:hypothetical protein
VIHGTFFSDVRWTFRGVDYLLLCKTLVETSLLAADGSTLGSIVEEACSINVTFHGQRFQFERKQRGCLLKQAANRIAVYTGNVMPLLSCRYPAKHDALAPLLFYLFVYMVRPS